MISLIFVNSRTTVECWTTSLAWRCSLGSSCFLGISDLTWTWKLSNDSLLLQMRLVGVAEQLLVRKLESICPRISLLFSILNLAPNLLSLFESPSRMTCNRRLDITAESHAKFRHGLLQLMIHTIDPLHDGQSRAGIPTPHSITLACSLRFSVSTMVTHYSSACSMSFYVLYSFCVSSYIGASADIWK